MEKFSGFFVLFLDFDADIKDNFVVVFVVMY